MKNIFCICFVTLLFFRCDNSCDTVTDQFINASGKNIEIIVYKNYKINIPFETFSTKHVLQNNETIKRTFKSCPPAQPFSDIEQLLQGDSIIIDFGDKKIRYGIKNLSSVRNPYFLAIGNRDLFNFTYTLTPEDYANALP